MEDQSGRTVGGETYQRLHPQKPARRTITLQRSLLGWIAAVIVLCGLSFYGGTAYQKGHASSTTGAINGQASQNSGFGFGGGRRMNGGIGTVTAVNSSSITVSDQRSGTSKTYGITTSTQITDNGSPASVSDIKTGDTVLVSTSSSSSSAASRIVINPSFGGGMMGPRGSGSPDTGTQTN